MNCFLDKDRECNGTCPANAGVVTGDVQVCHIIEGAKSLKRLVDHNIARQETVKHPELEVFGEVQ